MKLVIILYVFGFVNFCCGAKFIVYDYGLHSQRAVIPAQENKIAVYDIKYPQQNGVENNNIQIKDILYHNNNISSPLTLRSNVNIIGKVDYILKSEPGHEIDAIITTVFVEQRLTLQQIYEADKYGRYFEQKITVPASNDGFIQHEVRLKHTNGLINNIRAIYPPKRNNYFDIKIIDGGTGFDHVTILIESDRKWTTDVLFVLF